MSGLRHGPSGGVRRLPALCAARCAALWATLCATLLFGLLAVGNAAAQEVWRCGADGRSYRDKPCADGHAVHVADPRDAAQRTQAEAVAAREQQLAQQLRQERRQREREARVAQRGAAGIAPAPGERGDRADHADRAGRFDKGERSARDHRRRADASAPGPQRPRGHGGRRPGPKDHAHRARIAG